MMDIFNPGLQYYVDKLNAGDVFTFIRLGDGEWSAIQQDRVRTSSGSQTLNHKSLQQGMIKVIARAPDDPKYILALRRTSYRANITGWLEQHAPKHVKFHDCTVLYKASKKGQLYPFVETLRNLNVPIKLVGPERLSALDPRVFSIGQHIQIPGKNCWAQRERILEEALRARDPACYLVTAGPAGKVFCWSLFQRVGQHSWIIDCGSLWDPYVGRRTRTYHKRLLNNPDILWKNLGQ
jgi:hypothetical protein